MNIHDYIHARHDGTWLVKYEHRTTKYPERNYGTGTTQYQAVRRTGWSAVIDLTSYCLQNNIKMDNYNELEWRRYYSDYDHHIEHMLAKKGKVSESEWQMAFSCDAPNKPGYQFANND